MLTFVLVALLITVLSIVFLVRPLLKSPDTEAYERHVQNIHFARERLAELEEQRSSNKLSAQDYDELRQEIEDNLAKDIDLAAEERKSNPQAEGSSNAVVITLLCCLVPVAALGLYVLTGTPTAISMPAAQAANNENEIVAGNIGADAQNSEINSLLRSLENRLAEDPNDIQGWIIAARTYQQLGKYPESVRAYKQLIELDDSNPDFFAGLADVSALQAGGILAGQPTNYVEKALALDPNHMQAMWLAGLAAAQGGDTALAMDYWNRLMPLLADYPQQQADLRDVMQQTAAAENLPLDSNRSPQESAAINSEDEQNKPQVAQSPNAEATQDGPQLTLAVSLDDDLKKQAQASDTVFVFARAKQGPPAPLAVKRLKVSDLPTTVILSSADAMMPQLTLALFEEVVVSARISKSGNPIAQPGDLQSELIELLNTETATQTLHINQQVQ